MGTRLSPGRYRVGTVVALALALVGSACGAKQFHTIVQANTVLSQAIFALQDAEIASHDAHLITDADHARYKVAIRTLLMAGDDLTVALQHWQPDQPMPANLGQAIADVAALLVDVQAISPRAGALIAKAQTVLDLLQRFGSTRNR